MGSTNCEKRGRWAYERLQNENKFESFLAKWMSIDDLGRLERKDLRWKRGVVDTSFLREKRNAER